MVTDKSMSTSNKKNHGVSKIISRLRNDRGFSISELALRAGTEPSTISRIENGQQHPSFVTVFQITEALDISLLDFIELMQENPDIENALSEPESATIEVMKGVEDLSENQIDILLDVAKSIEKNLD